MEIKTLTFFSNYFNHHQKALCDQWYSIMGDGFVFVETEPMEGFRSEMGWGPKEIPPYVLKTYESVENHEKALSLGRDSDLVVMGTAPEIFIEERLVLNKLTFRYSERPLKEGFVKFFIPRLTKKYIHLHVRNRKKNIHILAASAFTTWDYNKMFGSYPNKCYKFGYFPVHKEYDIAELFARKREAAKSYNGDDRLVTILWEGRMLKLKHPELVVLAAERLKERGYNFHLIMVGEGEMRDKVETLAKEKGLSNITTFIDFLSPEEAREKMADAEIFVMTSNKLEGWGSVIYEALNAGCAVVASHAAGATPWLVKHEETGLVFESGSVESLTNQLEKLFNNPKLIEKYGRSAYEYMHKYWNPKTAAANVLTVAKDIEEGREISIKEGPCSRAGVLKNNWYKDR